MAFWQVAGWTKVRGTESWSEGRTAEQFHGGIVEWEGRGRVRIGGIRVLFVLLNHFIIYLIIDLKLKKN